MPKFYFNITTSHGTFSDADGSDCVSLLSARNIAISSLPMIAAEELPNGERYRASVTVSNESGRKVFETTLEVDSVWYEEVEPFQ